MGGGADRKHLAALNELKAPNQLNRTLRDLDKC